MRLSKIILLAAFAVPAFAKVNNLRFLSWAIRYDSKPDSITVTESIESLNSTVPDDDEMHYYSVSGEVAWSTRRIPLANEILFNNVHVFAVQGALVRQVQDLVELLGDWSYVGVGRDDGVEAGEWIAIFYDSTITLLDSDTFWLSNSPFEPSKYPGAGSFRTAIRAKLRTHSKNVFTVLSTHLDDQSDAQRRLGASMVRYRGAYEAAETNKPVFLLGCLNSESSGSSDGAYQIATGGLDLVAMNSTFTEKYASSLSDSFFFQDLMSETPVEFRKGHHSTVSGWNAFGSTSGFQRTSFALGGTTGGWNATGYKVGENFYDDEFHLSNHRPLFADVSIGKAH